MKEQSLVLGIIIAFMIGFLFITGQCSELSYNKRKAECKAKQGQWIEAMTRDHSSCLQKVEP